MNDYSSVVTVMKRKFYLMAVEFRKQYCLTTEQMLEILSVEAGYATTAYLLAELENAMQESKAHGSQAG